MRKPFAYLLVGLLVASVVLSGLALYQERQNALNDKFTLTGLVTVTVTNPDGTVVSQTKQDAITTLSYDYIACLVWGAGCSTANSGGGGCYIFPCGTTITTTATISSYLAFNTYAVGIGLSTASQTGSACNGLITTSGLSATVASVSHSTSNNSPIVTLTASWTSTGSISPQAVCLLPATTNANVAAFSNAISQTGFDMAYENFSAQSLTSGQSISVTWSFNM